MIEKPARRYKEDDPAESKRFIDMAREVEAAETPEAFERAFEKIIRPIQKMPQKAKRRNRTDSD